MKKIKRLNQLRNDNIMNGSYVVVDLFTYNDMFYKNIKAGNTWTKMYSIIYDSSFSNQEKYDKLKDILMKGGE